jgi:hypothetical protein
MRNSISLSRLIARRAIKRQRYVAGNVHRTLSLTTFFLESAIIGSALPEHRVADTKKPEDSKLPRPELNPLLNPVLASHMGRWAEVYFTHPPEKREEAVLELLRELQSNPAPPSNAAQPAPEEAGQKDIRITEVRESPPTAKEPIVCAACGHQNRSGQRFCGMCGTLLSMEAAQVLAEDGPVQQVFEPVPGPSAFTRAPELVSPAVREIIGENAGSPSSPTASPNLPRREPMWPRSTNTLPGFRVEPEPVPDRRRLYVTGVVALLLGGLLYLGWRSAARSSSAAMQEVKLPSSPTGMPSSQSSLTPAATPIEATIQDTKPLSDSRPAATRQGASTKTPPAPAHLDAPPPVEGGAVELAIAQKYLNGTGGKPRDSSEAAKWLWKATSKQNMAATLLLSDLYLRGDGVPHSCDQARVLLDAAARKGKAEAAERLSHLQAFGCQ